MSEVNTNRTLQLSSKDEEFLLYCIKELAKNISGNESLSTSSAVEEGNLSATPLFLALHIHLLTGGQMRSIITALCTSFS